MMFCLYILFCLYLGCGTGTTDDPDPVTGLTSSEKQLITNSWAVLKKDPTASGQALFSVLFKNHPHFLQLFSYRDVPIKDLPNSKKFQAHGNAVIQYFSTVVDAINDNELMTDRLLKLGADHVPRNVPEHGFIDLKQSMMELFSSRFNEEEMKAWRKFSDVAFDIMIKGLREKLKASPE